jgi:hypothetical protein
MTLVGSVYVYSFAPSFGAALILAFSVSLPELLIRQSLSQHSIPYQKAAKQTSTSLPALHSLVSHFWMAYVMYQGPFFYEPPWDDPQKLTSSRPFPTPGPANADEIKSVPGDDQILCDLDG